MSDRKWIFSCVFSVGSAFGLLYSVSYFSQAFRAHGHEVLIASAGKFAQKSAEAGLVAFDATPGFDPEATIGGGKNCIKKHVSTKMDNSSKATDS